MAKRIILGLVVLLALAGAGVGMWARSVLTGDAVRAAVAAQIAAAIGQPVTIGDIGASIYPRVSVDLADVAIGDPVRVRLGALHIGTDFGALLSRRIEHGAVRADRVRLELPLPPLAAGGAAQPPGEAVAAPPVEIVSIDEIALRNVEVVSGDRTLRGDAELVPERGGVRLRRVALSAEDTTVEITGLLSAFDPIEGEIAVAGRSVDLDRLLAFLAEFAASAAPAGAGASGGEEEAGSAIGRLVCRLTLDSAASGGLALSGVSATAIVTPGGVALDPLAFGVFGGRYEGSMRLQLGTPPRFAWRAAVSGVDLEALMTYAGAPGTISGTLAAQLALEGTGLDMDRALRSARGTLGLDVTDGTVAHLGLVRAVVTATSMRGDRLAGVVSGAREAAGSRAERFSRLGGTMTLADGVMRTADLVFRSPDVDLTAAGTLSLATLTADLAGRVQLSEALSKEAGSDLYRYTQEGGRVTLPATVRGPLTDLAVRVDLADASRRAIRNRATEEIERALDRNTRALPDAVKNPLRGLVRKRPPA